MVQTHRAIGREKPGEWHPLGQAPTSGGVDDRVVRVTLRTAAGVEEDAFRLVERRTGLEALHEVGIGKRHGAQCLDIRTACGHVGADLIAGAARPVQNQRTAKGAADLLQKRIAADMEDMKIARFIFPSSSRQITIEIVIGLTFCDAACRHAGRKADRGLIRADGIGTGAGNFEGKARPVLHRAAIDVGPLVRVRRQKTGVPDSR